MGHCLWIKTQNGDNPQHPKLQRISWTWASTIWKLQQREKKSSFTYALPSQQFSHLNEVRRLCYAYVSASTIAQADVKGAIFTIWKPSKFDKKIFENCLEILYFIYDLRYRFEIKMFKNPLGKTSRWI